PAARTADPQRGAGNGRPGARAGRAGRRRRRRSARRARAGTAADRRVARAREGRLHRRAVSRAGTVVGAARGLARYQAAQSPVDTAVECRARASTPRITSDGTPKPPPLPTRAANSMARTAPARSTAGPPESPWRTAPRTLVIVRATGPWPYAFSVSTTLVDPRRPGTAVSGPFSG